MTQVSQPDQVPPRPVIDLPLGQLLSTPGAIEAMTQAGQNPMQLLDQLTQSPSVSLNGRL